MERARGPLKLPTPSYRRNARGQTLGTAGDSPNPAQDPDLIRAVATNGQTGYVLTSDLNGPLPADPVEAAAITEALDTSGRMIPVFDEDGVTVIGTFRIGGQP